jgi:UDP-2-acetamido-2-deoxy-ribo-hexuluronate aminotransferase
MEFIDIKKQYRLYKSEIDKAIHEVLDSGHFIMGEQVKTLEEKLASYVGVKHCITVSSGTDTLLIALMALGVGHGDEVITVPFTFISTTEVVFLLGAKPVFVDIEPDTYNIDISKIESAITPKTKAIMPVSLFGQMPDMKAINRIAEKYGLPVIEDAAQSFGATQNGMKSCGMSTIGSTSFFPAKPLGCYGDGGALFTDDEALADKMFAIRTHGSKVRHHYPYVGINGRFDTIQAAVLLAKFPHYPGEVEARIAIGARYSKLLKEICTVPAIQKGNTHVYAQYTIRSPYRDHIGDSLKAKGIPTAVYYPKCLHEQPVYADLGLKRGSFPVAEKASQEVISLPMHPWLSKEDQDRIVDAVKEALLVTA